MTRFERLEAARLARDDRDYTAPASVERPSAPFAYKGVVVHRHVTARVVSDDGLRFEYAGTPSAERHFKGKR